MTRRNREQYKLHHMKILNRNRETPEQSYYMQFWKTERPRVTLSKHSPQTGMKINKLFLFYVLFLCFAKILAS